MNALTAAMKPAHTPGPWGYEPTSGAIYYADGDVEPVIAGINQDGTSEEQADADGRLIAASPTMADAIKGLIGLCQLLRNRDDCPSEIRQALTHNHRLIAGYQALDAAGIAGFQPTDFDLAKVAR
jgi:hypothetical protein